MGGWIVIFVHAFVVRMVARFLNKHEQTTCHVSNDV